MRSLKIIFVICFIFINTHLQAFGKIGHRVIAEIASRELSKSEHEQVLKWTQGEPLWRVSTWADEVRSDSSYRYSTPWHYVNFPYGKTYFDSKRSAEGDLLFKLFDLDEKLITKKLTPREMFESINFLVHFMGDLHQPWHIGISEDKGGNTIDVMWFNKHTNIHAVWDEHLIEFQQLSYTEYAQYLIHKFSSAKNNYCEGNYYNWAQESRNLLMKINLEVTKKNLSYEYSYNNLSELESQLYKASQRLACILKKLVKQEKNNKEFLELNQKIQQNI